MPSQDSSPPASIERSRSSRQRKRERALTVPEGELGEFKLCEEPVPSARTPSRQPCPDARSPRTGVRLAPVDRPGPSEARRSRPRSRRGDAQAFQRTFRTRPSSHRSVEGRGGGSAVVEFSVDQRGEHLEEQLEHSETGSRGLVTTRRLQHLNRMAVGVDPALSLSRRQRSLSRLGRLFPVGGRHQAVAVRGASLELDLATIRPLSPPESDTPRPVRLLESADRGSGRLDQVFSTSPPPRPRPGAPHGDSQSSAIPVLAKATAPAMEGRPRSISRWSR